MQMPTVSLTLTPVGLVQLRSQGGIVQRDSLNQAIRFESRAALEAFVGNSTYVSAVPATDWSQVFPSSGSVYLGIKGDVLSGVSLDFSLLASVSPHAEGS